MRIKRAFTLLELVFVIVIIGVVGKFGVEFLNQAYNNYIFSTVNSRLQAQSEFAVEFIASRLQHRIKDSVIARDPSVAYANNFTSLSDANGTAFSVLEWVGSDIDGLRGFNSTDPTYSGIIDLDDSNASRLISPESNTTAIGKTILALSGANAFTATNRPAIYFIGSNNDIQNGYGWNGTALNDQANSVMHPIIAGVNLNEFASGINGDDFSGVDVYEYYKLAWSAYAIEHLDDNLTLSYNYQPWLGERYNTNARRSLIMQGVTSFKFLTIGSLIKIQVCVGSDLIEDYSICKEKTIY